MLGCGKIRENDLLSYIDGRSECADIIEAHLLNCRTCLDELMELNRINSRTSAFKPGAIPRHYFINLQLYGGSVLRAISSGGEISLIPLAATRGEKPGCRKAVYTMDSIPAVISILPAGNGSCRINLSSPLLQNSAVLIRRKGEGLPLYSKNTEETDVTFRGIGPGDYEICFGKYIIRIAVSNGVPL